MKKGIVKAFCIFTVCLLLTLGASALSPTRDFFVNDFAGVISKSYQAEMQSLGENLNAQTTAQVVCVTVNDMEGKDIDTYALNLARDWGIGTKEKDNGVLLILAVEEREVKIEVGYGLEGALTDVKCGRILDAYGMEYFKADNFSEGLYKVYNAIVNEVAIEVLGEPLSDDYDPQETEESPIKVVGSILGIIAVVVFVIIFGKGRHGGGGGNMMTYIVARSIINSIGRGGHGGHGGGGFRGGGGGFGGGGSSRGF